MVLNGGPPLPVACRKLEDMFHYLVVIMSGVQRTRITLSTSLEFFYFFFFVSGNWDFGNGGEDSGP